MHKLLQLLKKSSFYIPFTAYFIVFVALSITGFSWLKSMTKLPDSAYKDIFSLLLSIALLFCMAIICFGFISVFVSFLFFKWKQKKRQILLQLNTSNVSNSIKNKQLVTITIHPLLLPLLGFLRVRLLYDKVHYSAKFSLPSGKNKPFSLFFKGEFNWNLPEIREYQIEKVIIYFEDFFQFFSFATTVNSNNRFHINPTKQDLSLIKTSPRKTEDTTTRIDELKRVEGELINYKNFENNDDVRRIVWKIYAKNKELVVRIPEILDPYASHIYLYTSFYTHFNVKANEVVNVPFLNYYKTICWSVYEQLSQKGFEVRYVTDQPIPPNSLPDQNELVKYSIAISNWQNETNLKDFVKPGYASVLVISSLNDLEQVKEFVENYGADISIVFVPLTDSLENKNMVDWVKWLFVENESNNSSAYKTGWNLSPLRFKVTENEKEITKLVKQTTKSSII